MIDLVQAVWRYRLNNFTQRRFSIAWSLDLNFLRNLHSDGTVKPDHVQTNRRRVYCLRVDRGSTAVPHVTRSTNPQREFEFSLGQGQASVGPALNFEIAISTKSEKNEQTPKTRRNRGRQPDQNNRHTNQQFLARGPAAAATKDISALDKWKRN